MGKTSEENLREAFAGESQANRKYLAFAKKAEEEGYHQVAKLFRAAAEAETVHAHNHLRVLKGIGSTKDNIQSAIHGETHEFKSMYPEMMEAAKSSAKECKILVVTILTSLSNDECKTIYNHNVSEMVLKFAHDAIEAEADGIVCSPHELKILSKDNKFKQLIKVTPGIRSPLTGS